MRRDSIYLFIVLGVGIILGCIGGRLFIFPKTKIERQSGSDRKSTIEAPSPAPTPSGTPIMLDWSKLYTATDDPAVVANLNPSPTPTAVPSPAFTPDPEVLAFANAVLAQRPWLEARSSDDGVPPGASPATTFILSRVEPIVTRDGDTWKITFK